MNLAHSLRTRLALVLVLAFAPIFALIFYRAAHEQARRLAEIEAYEQQVVRQIAATYAQAIERAHDVLRVLAQMPQIRRLDGPACNHIIAQLADLNSQYANFGVARIDGSVVCNGAPVIGLANVGGTQAFRRALASGNFSVGDYLVSPITGRPIIGLGLPVRGDNGEVVGIAGALLSVDWLNAIAKESLLPFGGTLTVVDHSGTIVVRVPNADKWVGQPLPNDERLAASRRGDTWYEGKSIDGVQRRFALATVKGIPAPAGLYVSATSDPVTTLAAVKIQLYRDLIVLLVAALFAFTLAWIGADRSVLRRINALVAATSDLAAGKPGARADLRSGPAELQQLGAAFDAMAIAVQNREREMRDAQRQLAEHEALLRIVFETLPVGVWTVAADGRIQTGNRHAREIWGGVRNVGVDDYGEYKAWRHGTDKRLEAHEWGVARALRTGATISNEIIDIESFDGARKTIAHWAVPLRDDADRIIGAVAVNQDITDRIREQSDLVASEQRFRALFDNAPDAIIVGDPDGRFTDVNRSGLRLLGYSLEEVRSLHPHDLVTPVDAPNVGPTLDEIRAGKPHLQEWTLKRKDGSTFIGEVFSCTLPNGKLLAIVRDVTDRHRTEANRQLLEAQLHQAQKMEALGTLAGGIAHDFNNILGAIIGNVELASQDVDAKHPAQTSLAEIRKASHRARDLVRQILVFSRQQPHERKVVQLREVVEESVRLLRATLPAGVELHVDYAPEVSNVLADRTQIHQVLMNLCTNAWHAMDGHIGRIDVSLADVTIDGDAVRLDLPAGHYVRLAVQDNGMGMDAEIVERIFDPFFTTKSPGDGTGLGLAVVAGVMKNHDGAIAVHSERNRGTTFELFFPSVASQADAAREAVSVLPHGKRQRILYLDDEEPLVLLAMRFLGRLGYDVTGYTHVQDALAAFRADPAKFDLLVTDLNMPGASGLDVAGEILRLRPDLPVALASGYVTEALRQQAKALGVREVIYKPNTAEDMALTIHRLLSDLA